MFDPKNLKEPLEILYFILACAWYIRELLN